MKAYIVGGAVRDQVLGLASKDHDWVVVGSTVESMIQQGFKPVGKDFPVFLHPKTKEEYALARTERKTAKGYHGFEFFTSPDVTLIEDLSRRDLTINAMAQDPDTLEIIDPYGGQSDCKKKQLRHVSSAFVEDPVRVLRLARFAAYLPSFVVAEETQQLVATMLASGEVEALVQERVWQECSKAFETQDPYRFFECLSELGVLPVVVPALSHLDEAAFDRLRALSMNFDLPQQRLACLGVYLDTTSLKQLDLDLNMPKEYQGILHWIVQYADEVKGIRQYTPEQILALLAKLDVWRRSQRFYQWLDVALKVNGLEEEAPLWRQMIEVCQQIDMKEIVRSSPNQAALVEAIQHARLVKIKTLLECLG